MKHGWRHSLHILFCGILLLGMTVSAAGSEGPPPRTSLKTVEGEVLEVGHVAGEGGIEVVQVRIAPKGDQGQPIMILLGPAEAMKSIGFTVEPGDTLKIKYFVSEEGSGKAHKVLNSSRGLKIRLRSLRLVPLWTNQGNWQGGPGRIYHGQGSGRAGGSP